MSGQNKGKGGNDQSKEAKDLRKVGTASGHTTPAKPKRPFSEVANSSAEEIVHLHNQIEEVSTDIKSLTQSVNSLMAKSESMMTKNDMQTFIKSTVEGIMTEINNNMEMTIETKVKEKTKHLGDKAKQLSDDIEGLKKENTQLKTKLNNAEKKNKDTETAAKLALLKANQNEQYSRKNNVKIMNIKEEDEEDENTLLNAICNLFDQHEIRLLPSEVEAIHRIPGKAGSIKPVLLKVRNSNIKTRIMRNRKTLKSVGHRLVDDVTKLNTSLITRLDEHSHIQSAWYFNGSIYGKTTAGKRLRFELNDDIDSVVAKSSKKSSDGEEGQAMQ